MLSMRYLLEEAKNLDLPILKKRAILREYLQTIILNSIYKGNFSKVMFFVGGTALRFFYNLPDSEAVFTLEHAIQHIERQ